MSLYNKNKVINFFYKNKQFLNNLSRFSETHDHDTFISTIKKLFNDTLYKILTTFFKTVTIKKNTIFCSGEAEYNHINKYININNNTVLEYTRFNNIPEINENTFNNRKGTRYFTSNFIGYSNRNLGSVFNISMAPTFLGESDAYIGRLLIYHNTKDIILLNTGVDSFQGRRLLAQILTIYILGNDYNLNKIDNDFTGVNDNCKKNNIDTDCTCGIWSGYGSLPEYFINYFFEISNYDNNLKIFGFISLDKNYDNLRNANISGTEYRIFCPDKFMKLEAILYMGNIYTNKSEYEKKIQLDMKNFVNSTIINKSWDNNTIPAIQKQIDDYIIKRDNKNPNIFYGGSLINKKNIKFVLKLDKI
jgi:hypothetical protein